MPITRRGLIVLAGTFALSGCTGVAGHEERGPSGPSRARGPVDAGPISNYPADGVYDRFRTSHGVFVIRRGNRLFAQSAVCTHRDCLLKRNGAGFLCPCHGSAFTADGQVKKGPAHRDLPRFLLEQTSDGRVMIHMETVVPAGSPESFLTIS